MNVFGRNKNEVELVKCSWRLRANVSVAKYESDDRVNLTVLAEDTVVVEIDEVI